MNAQIVNQWGPELLACLALLIGLVYQNSRLSDMRQDFAARLDSLSQIMNLRFEELNKRFDSEVKRLEEKIDANGRMVR